MNIDTNIAIAYFIGDQVVIDFIEQSKKNKKILFISAMVEAELISQRNMSEEEMALVHEFIDKYFVVIPIDRYTLKFASYFRRKYPHIKAADSCVLGVSKMYGLDLITRDKELLKIKEVEVTRI